MLWVLKEPSRDGSFEHPKQMMDKKILTLLCLKYLFIWRPETK